MLHLQFECNSKKKSEAVKEFESAEADSVSAFAEFEQLRTKMESIEEVRTFEQLYQQEENSKLTSECQKVKTSYVLQNKGPYIKYDCNLGGRGGWWIAVSISNSDAMQFNNNDVILQSEGEGVKKATKLRSNWLYGLQIQENAIEKNPDTLL